MGFKDVRARIILSRIEGHFQHEERAQAEGKNLLATGDISVEEIIELLRRCRGNQHQTGRHHSDSTQVIHIFKPTINSIRWYIKAYIVDQDGVTAIFISVHRS